MPGCLPDPFSLNHHQLYYLYTIMSLQRFNSANMRQLPKTSRLVRIYYRL